MDDDDCACGHDADDHLVRLAITGNVYGACRECDCTTYRPDET